MQENLNLETLQNQFRIVRSETKTSHVMEYGDMVSTICELIFGVDKVNVRYNNNNDRLTAFDPGQPG